MKIPYGIVRKLERQRCGIAAIAADVERELDLKVVYERKKHMTIYGPHLDILDLAVQTLIHRYVLKTPPKHGVLGQLQGKNAVWKFVGNYAKKLTHLFAKELHRLSRIKTVAIKIHPSRVAPVSLEVLCSVRVIEIVKAEIEKIVGQLHNLCEHEMDIPDDEDQMARVKAAVLGYSKSPEVLVVMDEQSRKVTLWGRNELPVAQVLEDLKLERKLATRPGLKTSDYVRNKSSY